jgi:hypothetical protein
MQLEISIGVLTTSSTAGLKDESSSEHAVIHNKAAVPIKIREAFIFFKFI